MRLLRHIGLVRPYRFERTLAVLVVFALGLLAVCFALFLRHSGQLDVHSMRGNYFLYVAALLVLGFVLAPWPRLSIVVLSLATLEIGFGAGSAVFVDGARGMFSPFPENERIDPWEPEATWHPLLQAVPKVTPAEKRQRTKFLHNSAGLRGKERSAASLSGKIVVSLFGGSTTYDLSVPDGETWGDLLEASLGESSYAVINHGAPGYTTAEHVLQTAFYEKPFGVEPRCNLYYIGWNDLRNNYIPNLDSGFADFHLPSQVDAQGARRLYPSLASISPVLRIVSGLAMFAFDTPRPLLQPQGELRTTLDPALARIYLENVHTISAINRQRGIRTLWIGQTMNRWRLTGATPYGWLPMVADKDVWPLIEQLNGLLRRAAGELSDIYVDVHGGNFDRDDFADEGHFVPRGSAKFAALIAPAVAEACR